MAGVEEPELVLMVQASLLLRRLDLTHTADVPIEGGGPGGQRNFYVDMLFVLPIKYEFYYIVP